MLKMADNTCIRKCISLFYTSTFRKRRLPCVIVFLLLVLLALKYSRLNAHNAITKYHAVPKKGFHGNALKLNRERKLKNHSNIGKPRLHKGFEMKVLLDNVGNLKQKLNPANNSLFEEARREKGAKRRLIVWYNGASRSWNTNVKRTNVCGKYVCDVSQNPKDIANADGVVVNAFYLKPKEKPPLRTNRNQIWMFYCKETVDNLRYVQWPSKYWKSMFNWTITYRTDSDIFFPYASVTERNTPKKNWLKIAKSKNRSVAWFVGHCTTSSRREDYVTRLQKHGVEIDIHGKCGTFKCPKRTEAVCFKSYKFYLAFESMFCEDYVTEKLFKVINHDIIPVVRGGANASRFPSDLFINSADFKTPKDLAKYLLYLDKNVTAYAELLKKKSKYRSVYPQPWCEMCKRLYKLDSNRKTYPDIDKWLDEKKCYAPADL